MNVGDTDRMRFPGHICKANVGSARFSSCVTRYSKIFHYQYTITIADRIRAGIYRMSLENRSPEWGDFVSLHSQILFNINEVI